MKQNFVIKGINLIVTHLSSKYDTSFKTVCFKPNRTKRKYMKAICAAVSLAQQHSRLSWARYKYGVLLST